LKLQESLENVLVIQSHSDNSVGMSFYVIGVLNNLGIPYEVDPFGNIIATKGSVDSENGEYFVGLACHLDTVHKIQDKFEVFSYTEEGDEGETIYSSPTGIGGDDKNGIAIVLWLLGHADIPNAKAFFFQREEKGCEGSEYIDHAYFDEVGYIIEPDRRGSTDLITSAFSSERTICSEDFRNIISPIAEKHGYSETSGSITDVVQLAEDRVGISVLNLSCGYHNPHSNKEEVHLKEFLLAGHMVREFILALGEKLYAHTMPPRKYASPNRGYWKNGVHYPYGFSSSREVVSPSSSKEEKATNPTKGENEETPASEEVDFEIIGETGLSLVGEEVISVPSLGGHFWVNYLDADEPDVIQVCDAETGEDITGLLTLETIDEILELLFLQGEFKYASVEYFFPAWGRSSILAKDDYYNYEGEELEEI